jgi:pimeloyl-ACP methyl ester carboxylesterase
MQAGIATIEDFAQIRDAPRAVVRKAAPAMATFLADDGEPIRVWRLGAGRPVVLLHGLTCSHRDWEDAARTLAQSHEVFAWQARAHHTDEPRGSDTPDIARMARDLANLIEHFDLPRVVLVGHSMGAAIVLEYLQRFGSAHVVGICLVDHSPRLAPASDWQLGVRGGSALSRALGAAAALGTDLSGLALRALGLPRKAVPEESERLVAERDALAPANVRALGRIMQSLLAADHREVLHRIDVPVLGVFGGASPLYRRVPLAHYYESVVANIRSVVYDDAGHSPHREMPRRFVADLLAFIEDTVSRSMHAFATPA